MSRKKNCEKNPFNGNIEFDIPREEAHIVKINKNKKLVVTGDSLLNGISEKMLSRNHQVTVKNFPGGTSRTFPGELRVADKPERIIIHALTLQKALTL